ERYGIADVKQMVIARISFNEKFQRIGNGVLLMLKLCEIARKFNYEIIRFEHPNEDCKAFAQRLGFNEKTWAIEREKLVSELKRYLKDKFKNSAGSDFKMKILKLCQKS
ncbi:GNAT family N-acetyltransferase, partial [Acinetobacter terrae]|uniref:GNAT family N-acetyltransferase n=1 Tax=Acinetobacter terrae TaxID=2731247 RepID=UPI00390CC3AC